MRVRRGVIQFGLAVTLSWLSFPANAQQPAKIPRIGFQLDSPASSLTARIEAFRQGLRELGYSATLREKT